MNDRWTNTAERMKKKIVIFLSLHTNLIMVSKSMTERLLCIRHCTRKTVIQKDFVFFSYPSLHRTHKHAHIFWFLFHSIRYVFGNQESPLNRFVVAYDILVFHFFGGIHHSHFISASLRTVCSRFGPYPFNFSYFMNAQTMLLLYY